MTLQLQSALPRVLITMGEPAGIGPELIVRAAQKNFQGQLIACADPDLLQQVAKRIDLPLTVKIFDPSESPEAHQPGNLWVEEIKLPEDVVTGKLSRANAAETLRTLDIANQMALDKKVDAIVTGPVHKANINQVAMDFLGHTEYFAKKSSTELVVMMLATNDLRICLQTTHLPLSEVPKAITAEKLRQTILTIAQSFTSFKLASPRIAVCGLNPHAGENGLLGHEDDQIIKPVIEELAKEGLKISGPLPADTLFTMQKRQDYDVFLAMYHDQGLPVVKAAGFGQCANITLGLPYIRTSVDHGTALDIAEQFNANADSLIYAINYALSLASGNLPR